MRRFIGRSGATLALASALVLLMSVAPASAARTRDCTDRTLEPGGDLQRCDLREMPVSGANLTGANLDRVNLAGMDLDNGPDGPMTKLYAASVVRADLSGATLSETDLRFADFSGSDLSGTDYETAMVADAIFRGADLTGAEFFFTDLRRVDFVLADLSGASLAHSYVLDADFGHARLAGADFTGANLTGANFEHASGLSTAIWSETTCPDGTASDDNGGTCVGHL